MTLCEHRTITTRGFAYIWVLLIVAFMGIGLVLGAEIYRTSTQRDKERELLSIGRQFRTALGRYHEAMLQAGRKEYPVNLEDLLHDKRTPELRRHLRKLFVDPMTAKEEWGVVRVGGRIVGVRSLSEEAPIKQDGFEAEDAVFRGKTKYRDWVFTYPADLMLRLNAQASASPSGSASAPQAQPSFFEAPAPLPSTQFVK